MTLPCGRREPFRFPSQWLFPTLADAGFGLQFYAFTTSRLNRSWAFGLPPQYGSMRTSLPGYNDLKLVA